MRRFLFIAALLGATLTTIFLVVSGLKLSAYRIQTGSMEPDFPVGTIVVDSGLVSLALHKPITFVADGETVTHVLVGYNSDGSLVTRGTANQANDMWQEPVTARDVKGRVLFQILFFSPAFWVSGKGVATLAGIACMGLALYFWNRSRRAESRNRFVIQS